MQNPFVMLGVRADATVDEVRAAYHERVKRYHPDIIKGEAQQRIAEDKLVEINIAYKEAMRRASSREETPVCIGNAKQMAKRLLEQGHLDSAFRVLQKAGERDAEWFSLQGMILLRKGEAEAAHASFRTAVRLEPENTIHRQRALDAAVQMRKQKTIRGRMSGWARNIVGRML